jgi:glycolate oxidase FAD binding subunit
VSADVAGGAAAADDVAVAGVTPGRVAEPATLDEAAEIVAACARDGARLAFVGGGTELGLGRAPEGLDVVLRTRALGRVVEHAPLDQIVTVECGVRVAELQRRLAAHGQMLALDPPWAERATVGGVVATAAFGARRTRQGSVRDLVIGASFVRADGARARGGGKVVKNVAGFDVPKLLVGSLGTLGLVATVTFRLHPLPEASASVVFPGVDAASVRRVLLAARKAQLEPAAAAALTDGAGGTWRLGVRFEGFEQAVADQCRRLAEAATALGVRDHASDSAASAAFWAGHQTAREAPAELRLKMAHLPADPSLAELYARLAAPLRDARSVLYPTLGLGFVAGDLGDDAAAVAAVAAAVEEARARLAPSGGSVVVHEAPAAVRALCDVWGPEPAARSAWPLMRAVKQRLDPERLLAPGRLVGGI